MARRLAGTVLLAIISTIGAASPASAHTVSGVGATNWFTRVTAIRPAVAGLTIRVIELGSRLELDNTGPEVTVLGYTGEPYLRVGLQGVYENLNSPATYLNRTRNGATTAPPSLDDNPSDPPRWHMVSSGHVARWHDHRIHWMGGSLPPDVQRAPNQGHARPPWQVLLQQGPTTIAVTGSLNWVPGPHPWPWIAAALGLAVICAGMGRLRRWGRPLAVLTGLLLVVDITHSVGIATVASGGAGYQLLKFLSGSYYSFIGWILGAIAIILLLREKIDGLYAAAFAGLSAFLFSGLLDLPTLQRAHAPFAWGTGWDRLTVTLVLGVGAGLAGGALWALRRQPRSRHQLDDPDDFDFEVDDAQLERLMREGSPEHS
jgi:hypothetical protein